MTLEPVRVMFMYWGRHGAGAKLTLDVARAALRNGDMRPTISVSRQNELILDFELFGDRLFAIDTFASTGGALAGSWRIPVVRRQLAQRLRRDRIQLVIDMMPHIWSPLMVSAIHGAGAHYVPFVHDADPHLGDKTAMVNFLLDRAVRAADHVLTMSQAVADRLIEKNNLPPSRVTASFLPYLSYAAPPERRPPGKGEPWRLLFLGRIIPYKGLPLLLDAVEVLQAAGHTISLGVFGDGPLGESAVRLNAMGAEVVNKWLTGAEIADALARYHVAVLPYIEASQSGVAATAFGANLPVVATPVGGLSEQVADGKTGIIASDVSAPALAAAVERLLGDPEFYSGVVHSIRRASRHFSIDFFATDCVSKACLGVAAREAK